MFEIEFRKKKVTINRPFQVGIDVYQLAKLRMLRFYYDCLDYFIDIWGSHAKRSKERSGRSVSKSCKRRKRTGLHETNGTIARRSSSWSSKEPVGSPSAVNVITWGRKEGQSQAVIEGCAQAAEQAHMGPIRSSVERSGGRSHILGVQDGERHDANIYPK